MIFEYLKLNISVEDEEFNAIYPETLRKLAKRHWTPIAVAKQAAEYLAEKPGTKVLDIGSGVGKFCMVGASFTKGNFTGVEQRKNLVDLSNQILSSYRIKNVSFKHANINDISFSDYESFYFYNSFFENIDQTAKIDQNVVTSAILYNYYSDYLCQQLSKLKAGTRLVTYWSSGGEIPASFQIQFSSFDGRLKFWKKIS